MGICNIDVVVISRKHFLMRSIGLSGVPVRWKAFGLWAIAKIYFCHDYIRSYPDFPPSFAAPVRIPIMLLCAQRCLCNPRPPPASAGQVTPTLWHVQGPR